VSALAKAILIAGIAVVLSGLSVLKHKGSAE
jgi:hypothetical protein